MDNKKIWDEFLNNIQEKLTPILYETWFKDTYINKIDDNIVTIIVPMPFHKKKLSEDYYSLIKETFNEVTGTNFEFEFLLDEELTSKKKITIEEGIPFNNPIQANLNANYTFDNFVVGTSNKFAFTASIAVAENPGKYYNPLFIYGNSGLGKTHLMQAIGNYIIKESNKKVLYVTSNDFVNDFMSIWKNSKNDKLDNIDFFKNKYRNVDVLIIDDIQFLADTPKGQQEFFHTFNELYQEGKQIIISSDSSPDDLKKLEERLKTRFSWGLTVNINPPDYELRIEILKKKINLYNLAKPIDEDVLEYIANNCTSDVRKLEGAITRLCAYTVMFNSNIEKIDLEIANEALKDTLTSYEYMKNNIKKIQKVVADYYKITVDDLTSKKRTADIAIARQIAMYLCRILTDETSSRIGLEFGGKDHATVLHAFEKINKEKENNKNFEKVINILMSKLK